MDRLDVVRKIPFNPTDPWFTSLTNNAEFLFGSLEAAGARSVIEVGAYEGELTKVLLEWAEPHGGRIVAIDPDPQPPLARMADERDDLELVRGLSHEVLGDLELTDAEISPLIETAWSNGLKTSASDWSKRLTLIFTPGGIEPA